MGDSQIRYRKPRSPETDPNCNRRSKTTISSILVSPSETTPSKKKKLTFRGLGCTASSQVSVPAVIRTSANWESKKLKKKKSSPLPPASSSCVGVPDAVWCSPGMGLTTSVDCVVSRRPPRPKLDDGLERILLPPSYTVRRMVSPEDNPFLQSDTGRIRAHVSGSRHNRHVRHAFREGLAEIVMLQSSLLRGGRMDGLDRYGDLRLDVDNMSYEELLELGDRIGYVNTGLGEDDINQCLRRTKLAMLDDLSLCLASDTEKKCSICQEDYEGDDEMGKLNCGHLYHLYCIKQWLGQKNSCPICKTSAVSQIDAE